MTTPSSPSDNPLCWESTLTTGEVLRIRPVSHQDYQAVLDIGEVYDGWDYIIDTYHHIINDTKAVCLAGEINGKMVCIDCFVGYRICK